jgi:hypothetical protein
MYVNWNGSYLNVTDRFRYYHAGEDWANEQGRLAKERGFNLKNWYDFKQSYDRHIGTWLKFIKLTLWVTTDWLGYKYAVPIDWEMESS